MENQDRIFYDGTNHQEVASFLGAIITEIKITSMGEPTRLLHIGDEKQTKLEPGKYYSKQLIEVYKIIAE
jgi:hypothetical protein